jgi:GGDEF domain-containing protein
MVEAVGAALAKARHRKPVALVIFDFTSLEAAFPGERGGEEAQAELARWLRMWVPAEHLVAHLRGREFGVLIAGGQVLGEVERLAGQVVDKVRGRNQQAGSHRSVVTFVGIGYIQRANCGASHLLRLADIALGRARASGQATYVIVDDVPLAA